MTPLTADEWRSACLHFSDEIAEGTVEPAALARDEVAEAVRSMPVPSRPSRAIQLAQVRRGGLTFAGDVVAPLARARTAVMGRAADGPPRYLVRVDGFPHHSAGDESGPHGTEAFARVHEILAGAGVPYLVAVIPTVPRDPLDPSGREWRPHDDGERETLRRLRRDGVAFGVHGLDHRTRHTSPRKHSEFSGLNRKLTEKRLDDAAAIMAEETLHADVFVPPFDRFDRIQYPRMAQRWDVVTGGPASLASMGFQRTPLWRGEAVYMPAYAPLHGTAAEVRDGVRALGADAAGVWAPIVLDWAQEHDSGWSDLEALADELTGAARPWEEFLAAVDLSRRLGTIAHDEESRRA